MMRQLYEYHPVVGYRYIPRLRVRIPHEGGGYLMQVNEQGFRADRPFVAARRPGARRVLVFGDSFTAGDAVSNRQRYTELLEARMGQAGAPVEFYNFGLSSTGTDQQYLVWREFAQGIERDLVVIAVFVENIRRVAARYRPHHDEFGRERIYAKPYYELDNGRLHLHHVPPRREPYDERDMPHAEAATVDQGGRFPFARKLATKLGVRETLQRLTRYQPLPHYDAATHPDWLLMRAILSQWIGELDCPVLLMPLPLPQHLDETCDASGYQARFAELARDTGCRLHDPLPDLLRIPGAERRKLRWEQDIHFTPAGHAALAASMESVLADMLARVPQSRLARAG
jgi:carbamoyltransferase